MKSRAKLTGNYLSAASKVFAVAATLFSALATPAIAILFNTCRFEVLNVVITAIPLAQLLLIKAGLDREVVFPLKSTVFFMLAVACLGLQAGALTICHPWLAFNSEPYSLASCSIVELRATS